MLVIFDNDAAGVEAMQELAGLKLPPNVRLMALPDIPLTRRYPTAGPGGSETMDVNGRGAAIELYLGKGPLTTTDSGLRPVRWTEWRPKVGRYQGAVEGKQQVAQAFLGDLGGREPRGPAPPLPWTWTASCAPCLPPSRISRRFLNQARLPSGPALALRSAIAATSIPIPAGFRIHSRLAARRAESQIRKSRRTPSILRSDGARLTKDKRGCRLVRAVIQSATMRNLVDCADYMPLSNVVGDAEALVPPRAFIADNVDSLAKPGACSHRGETTPRIDVYDFFSGCGGTSSGLLKAGLTPRIAVDFDEAALATYARNMPAVTTLVEDISKLLTSSIEHHFERERVHPILICACAPCQPFSAQNRHKKAGDGRLTLLGHLRRFVERFRPELMLIENVPGLDGSKGGVDSPLGELLGMLDELGYHHDVRVLAAHDFGVPQARRRLLVAASLFGPVALPEPTHGDGRLPHVTVRDAIGHLPAVAAGAVHPDVRDHRAALLSAMNLRRIRSSRPGGSWSDWPDELRLPCHTSVAGYTDVYGRLDWDRPAPALTTRCISYSNGRYGHPEQDRAITVREAALLQTFDADFAFVGGSTAAAKQIGNAVPVRLAETIGHMFRRHVAVYLGAALG